MLGFRDARNPADFGKGTDMPAPRRLRLGAFFAIAGRVHPYRRLAIPVHIPTPNSILQAPDHFAPDPRGEAVFDGPSSMADHLAVLNNDDGTRSKEAAGRHRRNLVSRHLTMLPALAMVTQISA